jgi:hypothetical protein
VSSGDTLGAAWVFTRSGSTWTQQGAKLTASDETPPGQFGDSVALSSDGNTTLIGGPNDNPGDNGAPGAGAAWVFAPPTPTSTTVASSANPSANGQPVTYTASVSPARDGDTIAFTDNGSTIAGCAAAAVNTSTWVATCQTTYNTAGSHSIIAGYSGDASYLESASSTLSQTVSPTTPPPTTTTTPTTPTTTPPPTNAPPRCPAPSGHLRGATLGPLSLGITRAHARKMLPRFTMTTNQFDNFCLSPGWGIRAAYASSKLLAASPAAQRAEIRGRIVILLTANPSTHSTASGRVCTLRPSRNS